MEKIRLYFLKNNKNKYIIPKDIKDKIIGKKGVYIFYTSDDSVYIGQSMNIFNRMMHHKTFFNNKNTNETYFYHYIINNNLTFYVDVLLSPSFKTKEDILNKEKELVILFKQYSKYNVLNKTNGGYTVSDSISVDISKYETTPVCNYYFIRMCRVKGIDPSKYKRIDSGLRIKNGRKLFYFIPSDTINDIEVDRGYKKDSNPNAKDMEYYEINAFQIYNFKAVCKRRGWIFEHFKIDFSYKKGKKNYFTAKYIGEDNPYKFDGLTHKIAESKNKPVMQLSMEGIIIGKYKSLTEASEKTGYNVNYISMCCNNKRDSYKNFIWRFV